MEEAIQRVKEYDNYIEIWKMMSNTGNRIFSKKSSEIETSKDMRKELAARLLQEDMHKSTDTEGNLGGEHGMCPEGEHHAAITPCCGMWFWIYLLVCIVLILFAGFFSGMTVGIIGMETSMIMMKEKYGTAEEKEKALQIKDIKKNHHLLLVTLLLGNALSFETLPIFIHKLVPAWAAILVSTTFILVFGEVVPMSV